MWGVKRIVADKCNLTRQEMDAVHPSLKRDTSHEALTMNELWYDRYHPVAVGEVQERDHTGFM
jgi:hypothetical protein